MNNLSTALPNPEPWYAHRWPWLLMLGPFLVLIAGVFTSWLAFSQPDALVVDDYYKQGKAINQDLRRDQYASRLGLSLHLQYSPATGKLEGRLLSKTQSLTETINVRFIHSTQPQRDINLKSTLDADGTFSVPLPMLERARWQVQIENESRQWRLFGTWMWPQHTAIDIKAEG